MKSAIEQLSTYKSVHLNKNNLKTHFVGIPLIIWSIFVAFATIRFQLPFQLPLLESNEISFASLFVVLVMIYYFMLNIPLALGHLLFMLPTLYFAEQMAMQDNALWIAAAVFVVGWVFQFVGHYYEKAKPAFVDDLNQLLIGPYFLMAELFFMLGGLKKMEQEVTKLAIDKRRIFENNKQASSD
ncbi:MAG: DUF962 domain-containing protein [Enterobacterales bacterium]|nr:DUF962 domain-containing protein [Enterobacterales bacterium]